MYFGIPDLHINLYLVHFIHMNTATINQIKKTLNSLPAEELISICLSLAKFKKENKEFLTYLLFESGNEQEFIDSVREYISGEMMTMNKSSVYLAKKTVRKVLRQTKKYIRFSGRKETELDLLMIFCEELLKTGLPLVSNKVLFNIYQRQWISAQKALHTLHEDLQFDYREKLESLELSFSG